MNLKRVREKGKKKKKTKEERKKNRTLEICWEHWEAAKGAAKGANSNSGKR